MIVASPDMIICVESFVGPRHVEEVIKLQQHIVDTETGNELLTRYPHDADCRGAHESSYHANDSKTGR